MTLRTGDESKLALKSYDPKLRVYFFVGDKNIHASDDPLEWFLTTSQLRSFGGGELRVVVFDSHNRYVVSKKLSSRTN